MHTGTQKSQRAAREDAKDVSKKPQFKIIIRRLPTGFSQDELLTQIEPLDDCTTLWFRKANKMMEPCSFTRAYLAFEDWTKAVEFKQKFNGYVFVDKQGNESAAIVELAVHQEVPKSFAVDSANNDRRVGTLEDKAEYKEFLEEFNNLVLHKVTNFDELIRAVEEKEKRQEKGMVCETPLVKFIVQQAVEKEKKRFARLEKHKPKVEIGRKNDVRNEKKNVPSKVDRKDVERKDRKDGEEKKNTGREKRTRRRDEKNRTPRNGELEDKKLVEDGPIDTPSDTPKNRDRGKSKDFSEFGNSVPKLLARNRDDLTEDQTLELPAKNEKRVPKSNNVKADKEMNGKSKDSKSSNDKKHSEDSENSKDEKRRRNAQRPERQIYRPPVRNRDNKKTSDAET